MGVAADSLKDMEILLEQIPLDRVSTSMTINAPAAVLLAMYIAAAEKKGIPRAQLKGTIQNDILKEYAARGAYIFPPRESMRLVVDILLTPGKRFPLEYDQYQRLPYPGSRLHGGAGDRFHLKQCDRLRGGCSAGGA